jgi:pentatricopeptide repeat protein
VVVLIPGRVERPDRKMINLAMRACAMAKRWEDALALLRGMGERGLRPDEWSYNTAIHACAQAGASDLLGVLS